MVLGGVGRLATIFRPQSFEGAVGQAEGFGTTQRLAWNDRLVDGDLESEGWGQAWAVDASVGGDSLYTQLRAASRICWPISCVAWCNREWCGWFFRLCDQLIVNGRRRCVVNSSDVSSGRQISTAAFICLCFRQWFFYSGADGYRRWYNGNAFVGNHWCVHVGLPRNGIFAVFFASRFFRSLAVRDVDDTLCRLPSQLGLHF